MSELERLDKVTRGVAEAWGDWLRWHDVTVPDCIELAVRGAFTRWLDDHADELVEAIARHAAERRAP